MKKYVKNRGKKSSHPQDVEEVKEVLEEVNTTSEDETLSEEIQQDILNMLEDTMEEARKKYPNAVTQINTFLGAIGEAAESILTSNKKNYESPVEVQEAKPIKEKKEKRHESKLPIITDDEEDDGIIDLGSEEDEDDDVIYEDDVIDLDEFDEDED